MSNCLCQKFATEHFRWTLVQRQLCTLTQILQCTHKEPLLNKWWSWYVFLCLGLENELHTQLFTTLHMHLFLQRWSFWLCDAVNVKKGQLRASEFPRDWETLTLHAHYLHERVLNRWTDLWLERCGGCEVEGGSKSKSIQLLAEASVNCCVVVGSR